MSEKNIFDKNISYTETQKAGNTIMKRTHHTQRGVEIGDIVLPTHMPEDVANAETIVLPRARHNIPRFKKSRLQEVLPIPTSNTKYSFRSQTVINTSFSTPEQRERIASSQNSQYSFQQSSYVNQATHSARPYQQPSEPQQFSTFVGPTSFPQRPAGPAFKLPVGQTQLRKPRKRRRFPLLTRILIGVFLFLLVIVGSGIKYYYATFDVTLKNTVGQVVTRSSGDNAPSGKTSNNGDILSGKRINILLLGSDTDIKFTDASGHSVYLAQTDIVVTIDPQTRSVGMLSIPRDTWLNAPGYGMMKLDEVYKAGGVALSRYTIHQDFGIYIDYYAWVGLDGFIKVINTVGGIDVDVLHPIADDNYPDDIGNHGTDIYAMKRLYLAPGPQHLTGPEALEYVRSRHADLVGDFGRSVRQQQVLTQLKTKLNNPAIIGKLPELSNDLNGFVKTDMQLPDVFRLMNFARLLDQSKINRVTLGPPYSQPAQITMADGTIKDVVELDCGQVQPIIATMFNLGATAKCDTQGSTGDVQETQSVLNTTFLAAPSQPRIHTVMASSNGSSTTLSHVHSLLDLMFLVVFKSPNATNV